METRYEPTKETYEEFMARAKKAGDEYAAKDGVREANQIFAENREELRSLMAIWENNLRSKPAGMDRAKIAAFVAEAHRLLGE